MDKTLGYLLCCQSPALFLGALALLAGYIIRHRNHRVHAALDLVLAIVCLLGGVALYYLGMLYDHFTIHDFWQIRVPGWVGLVLAAIVIVVLFVQNIGKAAAVRRRPPAPRTRTARSSRRPRAPPSPPARPPQHLRSPTRRKKQRKNSNNPKEMRPQQRTHFFAKKSHRVRGLQAANKV